MVFLDTGSSEAAGYLTRLMFVRDLYVLMQTGLLSADGWYRYLAADAPLRQAEADPHAEVLFVARILVVASGADMVVAPTSFPFDQEVEDKDSWVHTVPSMP